MISKPEKLYIIILTSLLILSIVILLVSSNNEKFEKSETFKKETNKVLILSLGDFRDQLEQINKIDDVKFDLIEFLNPGDVSPEKWNQIATTIFDKYPDYDAFILLNNVDTITWIASALSFMLENIDKSVVLTSNLQSAYNIIKEYNIPEVIIVENDSIIRGCRAKKIKNQIISPNYPVLGDCHDKIIINSELILKKPIEPLKFIPIDSNIKIAVFKLYPNFDSKYLSSALKDNKTRAIILESYHNGHIIPDKNLYNIIRKAIQDGIFVVNVSQTFSDVVDNNLSDIGVLSGGELTTEAALTKLYLILSNVKNINNKMLGQMLLLSIRGEL